MGTALILLIKRASRPPDAVLGRVRGLREWHSVADYEDAETTPGFMVYRFAAAILFFNAGCFRRRVLDLIADHPDIEWFIVDGSTINLVDLTGGEMLVSLASELAARGVHLGLARLRREVRLSLERAGALTGIGTDFVFPTLNSANEAFLSRMQV